MANKIEPVYCTPDDVAETLDLPDPNDNYGTLMFSDMSHPTQSRVCKMIRSNEDRIDRLLKRTYRENRVEDQIFTIENYWHDINGFRQDYYLEGGNYIQLRKDVLEWDPDKGDKLELKTRSNLWIDISRNRNTTHDSIEESDLRFGGGVGYGFWFDYKLGKLYLRVSAFQNLAHSIRITYRYGQEVPIETEEITDEDGNIEEKPVLNEYGEMIVKRDELETPDWLNRLCCLMTAIQILNMQMFNVKVGVSGDLGEARSTTIREWKEEINEIKSAYQRSGAVRSLYR